MASNLRLEMPGSNIPLLSCTTWLGTVLAMLSRLRELGWAGLEASGQTIGTEIGISVENSYSCKEVSKVIECSEKNIYDLLFSYLKQAVSCKLPISSQLHTPHGTLADYPGPS